MTWFSPRCSHPTSIRRARHDLTKLTDLVAIGKQMLITRRALTALSIANDVAKNFAVIPAMFIVALPGRAALNVTRLAMPRSAVLSALIFNVRIIPARIPLTLRGVRFRVETVASLFSRNRHQDDRSAGCRAGLRGA
jgi:K+-transporting ATPase ATPase B chain